MARYIDADAVCEALKSMASVQCPDKQSTILGVVSSIENFPTADVAPRAEVEALKDEADRYKRYYFRHDYDEMIAEAKAEVAREIFWEIDKLLAKIITDDEEGTQFIGVDMQKYYALKKKYTESEPPKGD